MDFKNYRVKIDNAEDLDVVMPMYNSLEYSKNYKKTTGSYYRDGIIVEMNQIVIQIIIINSPNLKFRVF